MEKKFIIEDSFWKLFSNAKIGVVIAKGIDNSHSNIDYEVMIERASQKALEQIGDLELAKHPAVSVWRQAYKKFKSPKENRSSIEALVRRVYNGKKISSINPLVDIYNTISLRYLLPCGGEDLDVIKGDIKLTRAEGDEWFIPLGSPWNEPPIEGEVIYKDDEGAVCRCWNWREADRTKLTNGTKNAFLCIECIDDDRDGELKSAVLNLSRMINDNLGGKQEVYYLDINNREITFQV